MTSTPLSPTSRSTVGRHRERARTDRTELYAVLDAGLVCHLGLIRDGAGGAGAGRVGAGRVGELVVLPTGYGRLGDTVYVHGSTGARYLRAGGPACLTVTHLDGVVYARSVFSHSMNYRSAVVHGVLRVVNDADEVLAGLRAIVEQIAPGSWAHTRLPSARELAATTVLALDLGEASVKVRTGPPGDGPEDGSAWAGVLPVRTVFGTAQPCPKLPMDTPVPDHVRTRGQ